MFYLNLGAAVILKYVITLLLTIIICKFFLKNVVEAYAAGYVGTQLLVIAGMLLLSLFNGMTRVGMSVWLVLLIVVLAVCALKCEAFTLIREKHVRISLPWYYVVPALCFAVLAGYIVIHSFYYFDCMPDAYAYGITRIQLWVQKHSLFVNMHSVAKNIFVNEWNGELFGVFYEIMTGTSRGIMFGNAENFVNSFVLIVVTCRYFGMKEKFIGIFSLLLAANPVMTIAAMITKGDYLVMLMLPLGFACFYRALVSDGIHRKSVICFCFAAFGLAAGSKVTSAAAAGMAGVTLVVYLICKKELKQNLSGFIAGGILALIGCMRFVVNLVYYHNPFVRVGCERLQLSNFNLKYLADTFMRMVADMWQCNDMHAGIIPPIMPIYTDYGIWGSIFLCLVPLAVLVCVVRCVMAVRAKTLPFSIEKFLIAICIVVSFAVAFACLGGYYPGSFRMYVPWINVLMIVVCIALISAIPRKGVLIVMEIVLLLGAYGTHSCYHYVSGDGEVTVGTIAQAKERSSLERQYACHPYILETAGLEESMGEVDVNDFIKYVPQGKKVLICNYVATICSYLYGEDNGNDVYFCYPNELEERLQDEEWDVVAISSEFMGEITSLPYQPDIYPEAVFDWIPEEMDARLSTGYTLFKPTPSQLRTHVYVNNNCITE